MNALIIIRLILVIIVVIVIDYLLKINKAMKIERRLSRYSINSIIDDDNSISDIMYNKYNHVVRKIRKKAKNYKILNDRSLKYDKYVMVGDSRQLIDFIVIKLLIGISFVVLIIISLAIQGRFISFFGMIIGFIFGYYIYDIYLYFDSKRKKQRIKNDMLRAVIIMNNAFKAGKSILQAVEVASRDLPKPISIEFKRIYQDLVFGISSDVAFTRFANRVNLDEARYLSSSLTILNQTGGNIVEVFNSIERTLFDRKKLEEDLKNSTGASNLIVKVLMVIPVIFVLIIYVMSPTYFDPLFSSVLGYFLIFIIIVMFAIYLYLLNKIMKVKV